MKKMFLIYVFLMSNLILSQYHLSFGDFDSEEQTLEIFLISVELVTNTSLFIL